MATGKSHSSVFGPTIRIGLSGFVLCLPITGCGDSETQPPAADQASSPTGGISAGPTEAADRSVDAADPATIGEMSTESTPAIDADPVPVTLGALGGASTSTSASASDTASDGGERQIASVIEALKPLQTMLGAWRGTTRMEYDGMKAVDTHEWVWDLKTDPERPALVLNSDKSPYVREARITLNPVDGKYVLTTTDPEGQSREFTGFFDEPVEEYEGDDRKMHRRFRLLFTESPTGDSSEQWQMAWAQQTNNRYLLQVDRRRGAAPFRRYDTVSTQREGTSFAADDSDYGDRECIISQGLGTTPVSWKGKTYWVCCSGCKAAFEDDPEKWLALAKQREAEQE